MKKLIFYSLFCLLALCSCKDEDSGEQSGEPWYISATLEDCNENPFDLIETLRLDADYEVGVNSTYSCTAEVWSTYNMRTEAVHLEHGHDFIGIIFPFNRDRIVVFFKDLHIKDYRSEWTEIENKYSLTHKGELTEIVISNVPESQVNYWVKKLKEYRYVKSVNTLPVSETIIKQL